MRLNKSVLRILFLYKIWSSKICIFKRSWQMRVFTNTDIMNMNQLWVLILRTWATLVLILKHRISLHISVKFWNDLIVVGHLTKILGTACANDENILLTNNVLMDIFTNIKYQRSGKTIESQLYPIILRLLKYPDGF